MSVGFMLNLLVMAGALQLALATGGGMAPPDVGRLLGLLLVAEVLGLLVALLPQGRRVHGPQAPLAAAALCVIATIALAQLGALPLLGADLLSLLCFGGLLLAGSVLHLYRQGADQRHRRRRHLLLLRGPLLALAIWTAAQLGAQSVDLALLLALLIWLSAAALVLPDLMRQPPAAPASLARLPLSEVALRHGDLLLLPFVLPAPLAASYVAARLFAMPLPLVLRALEQRSLTPLAQELRQGGSAAFIRVAARVNLGVLLIGGGAALVILAALPLLPMAFPAAGGDAPSLLRWLLLAEAAPMFFGLGAAMAGLGGLGTQAGRVTLLCLLGLVVLLALGAVTTPLALAQAYALSRFAAAGVLALLVMRRMGVWPGITAVFMRRIRLL